MLGTELHLWVANAACPGETSSSLIHASAQSNGCENVPAGSGVSYRKDFPLHVRYSGSQLAYAVKYLKAHPGVRLVSLMIGANDLFVCQETTAGGCASSAEQQQYRTFARASIHSGNNSCTAGLLTQLGAPGTCGVHPSYAGQALLAQTLEGAITTG